MAGKRIRDFMEDPGYGCAFICPALPWKFSAVTMAVMGGGGQATQAPRKAWQNNMPRVVFEEARGRQVVYTACDRALDQGIMPGMPLTAAYVLCQGLWVKPRSPQLEKQQLQKLATGAHSITPDVSLESPDCILLEVSGSLKMFGGFEQVLGRIRQAYAGEPVISSAPSSDAALLLARNGLAVSVGNRQELKSVLGDLAIGSTVISAKMALRLSKCGLKTLRDLWRLPPPDLARRFGKALPGYLDRLCGETADIREKLLPVTRFFQRIELPAETEDSRLILLAMESLLEYAAGFMRIRGSAAEKLVFKLWYSHRTAAGPASESTDEPAGNQAMLVIRSRQADRRPQRFLPQVREKIDRLDIDAPVVAVSLRIDQLLRYQCPTGSLFDCDGPKGEGQDWDQLLDVLSSRLGGEMIYGILSVQDHRPERAWKRAVISRNPETGETGKIMPVSSRPVWLLPAPRKIPASRLHLGDEAERIESGWWDGNDIRRDYYQAQTGDGSRCWVYRDLASRGDAVADDEGVYLHGLYG